MTESSKTTTQSQSSTSRPWDESMGLVNTLLGQYGSLNPGVTAGQKSSLENLRSSLSGLPNYGDAASGAVSNIFGSASSAPQVGMLNTAYDSLRTNLAPTASGANLDPYSTPGFRDAIQTAINDTTNQVKGSYAASGRDPSGAGSFAQSLGRGITAGIAPTIANQYNQNYRNMVDANNSIFSGAGQTASSINNLRAGDVATTLGGIQGAGAVPGVYSSPGMAQYGMENLAYGQPYQNLAQLLQPSIALASLGNKSSGTGTTNQTQNASLASTIMGGLQGGVGALGTTGAFGSSGWLLGGPSALLAFSDERLKEDIAPVGKLADGRNIYSYRYKGDPEPRIGLMAQEEEKIAPENVVEIGGFKAVNYGRALAPSKALMRGRVGALAEAA